MNLSPPWSGLRELAPRRDLWSILSRFPCPEDAARASPAAWVAAGLPLPEIERLGAAGEPGLWLDPTCRDWPRRLGDGEYGPVALSVEGARGLLDGPCVGIVGARACTTWGRGWARRLGAAVADAGGVVVSGLARGIDAEAHLAARGRTIAVLGQGLGAPMAVWQQRVRDQVLADGGLLVSELRGLQPASTFTFPIRNRVIAALARVVVVVEAGRRSGARNTAGHAIRLGRDVLAVPGPPESEVSVGCLDLIEEGATVVRGAETVLAAAGLLRGAASGAALVPTQPTALAELGRRLDLEAEALLSYLGDLELRGEVARGPGLRYARVQHGNTPRRPPGHGSPSQ